MVVNIITVNQYETEAKKKKCDNRQAGESSFVMSGCLVND